MSNQLYNSRIIDTYIKLIKSRYSFVDINLLLESADMKAYEVADQSHWFTQQQIDRFYEKCIHLTGDPQIAYEAGKYAASPDALGAMRQYALGMLGPLQTFEFIHHATKNFTRSSEYVSRKLSPNSVEITVTPQSGVTEKPFQCENRSGFFEAIVTMFGYRPPLIEHPECLFKGGSCCRYKITWQSSRSLTFRRFKPFFGILFVMLATAVAVTGEWHHYPYLILIGVFGYLVMTTIIAISENHELKTSLQETQDATNKLVEQIDNNYNNTLMNTEIGQILNNCIDSEKILAMVVRIMEKRLDFDRGMILLANPEKTMLTIGASYGLTLEQRDKLESVSFHIDRPDSRGIFVISFREQRPFLINDMNEIEGHLSLNSLKFARELGSKSFICCPILVENRAIGLVAVDNIKTKRTLLVSDISRVMGIASVIGISLRNAELIQNKIRQLNSVLYTLAASIDARDSLTSGHSEKVTEYSVGICRELGLSADETEAIRVAALLHDYGKIGVPDAILKKEGPLDETEYSIVQTHAETTRHILSRINFDGIYSDIPEIAGSHHEKMDGSGYPRGLSGQNIPLGSRIIAVADYFEAITARRHYRGPMPVDFVMNLLREKSGEWFDEQVVRAFISYYEKTAAPPPLHQQGVFAAAESYG